jgi:carboxyl-terminal processing protease
MQPTRLRTPRFRISRSRTPPFQVLIACFGLLAFVLGLSASAIQIAAAHRFPALNETLQYSREYRFGIDPGADSAPAPDRTEPQRLSEKDRREVFEKIWREIRDHYYDASFNGVNWDDVHLRYLPRVEATRTDAEFYAVMSQMTSELHDAHTRFNSPEHWRSYKKQQGATVGFSVDGVDGKTVVTDVEPGSNAARAGVEIGMFVVSVEGEPVARRLEHIEKVGLPSSTDRATRWFVYNRLFGGPANTEVKVGLQRPDGTTFEATIKRQLYSEVAEVDARLLASGNAYIRFDGFQHPIVKQFKEALEKYHNAPGLIIDLRKNGGGELSVLLPIASYFYNKKTLFAKDTTRSGKPLSEFAGFFKLPLNLYVGKPGSQIYSGQIAILVDSHSASSSEVFAGGMQETRRAKIVGTQSCGCVLGIAKPRFVKGGGVLEMSEVLWFTPNGRKLEGAGVIPDKTVSPTVSDFQRKRDVVLAEADKTLSRTVFANARP